jgi:hypothetical protein
MDGQYGHTLNKILISLARGTIVAFLLAPIRTMYN